MAEKKHSNPPAGLVELPAEPVKPAAEQASAPRRFHVKLKDCPVAHVTASDGYEAVKKYKAHCGILSTQHEFEVHELTEELAAADEAAVKTHPLHKQVHEIP